MKRVARRPLCMLLLASAFTLFPFAAAGERGAARAVDVRSGGSGTATDVRSTAGTATDVRRSTFRTPEEIAEDELEAMKSGAFSPVLALSSVPSFLLGTWVQIEDGKELGDLHISFTGGSLRITPGDQRPDNHHEPHGNHGPASMDKSGNIRYLEHVDTNKGMHYLKILDPSTIQARTDGNNLIRSYEMRKKQPAPRRMKSTTLSMESAPLIMASGFQVVSESVDCSELTALAKEAIQLTGIHPENCEKMAELALAYNLVNAMGRTLKGKADTTDNGWNSFLGIFLNIFPGAKGSTKITRLINIGSDAHSVYSQIEDWKSRVFEEIKFKRDLKILVIGFYNADNPGKLRLLNEMIPETYLVKRNPLLPGFVDTSPDILLKQGVMNGMPKEGTHGTVLDYKTIDDYTAPY